MKPNKISREIPDWFELSKYEMAKTFGPFEWACNLDIRAWILRDDSDDEFRVQLRALIKEHGAIPREICDEYVQGEIELFRGQGWTGELVYSLPLYRANDIFENLKQDSLLQHRLAVIDYQRILNSNRPWSLDAAENELFEWHYREFLHGKYDDFYSEYGDYSPHICVELEAPDEVLVEAFKTWLQKQRQKNVENQLKFNLGRKAGRWNFAKWCEYSVLPYLDLKIYEKEIKRKFTHHVIGNAIFPLDVEFDTTEAVRKTTSGYVQEALSAKNALMTHGYYEKTRKSEES